jgi:hypothetical protein
MSAKVSWTNCALRLEAKPTLCNRLGVDPGRSEDVGVTVGVECPNSEDSSDGFIGSKGIRESVDDGVGGGEFSNESSKLLEIFEKTVEFACANACLTVPRVDLLLATVAGLLETFRSTKRRSSSSFSSIHVAIVK